MAYDWYEPRPCYTLKPREFERVNEPRPEAPEPRKRLLFWRRSSTPTPRIDVHDIIRGATVPGPVLRTKPRPVETNDIHEILRFNVECDTAAGLNVLYRLGRKRSRRTRDYLLFVGAGNAIGLLVLAYALHTHNPILLATGIAGMFFYTVGVSWIMWALMNDY